MDTLYLMLTQGRLFGGKLKEVVEKDNSPSVSSTHKLEEAVEFHNMISAQTGEINIGSVKYGNIFIPKDTVLAEMVKDSPYYVQYVRVNAGLHLA